jgi:hypothetical protein
LLGASLPCAATNRISFCGLSRSEQREEKWGFWFQEERLAIWPRLPVVLESGRYRPFNFDNIAKQRNLNDKGKALAKALGDAIRWVGVPPARWAAPSGLAGIGNKDSR